MFATRDRGRLACSPGSLVTAARQHRPGAPGDPRAADRGRARGRDAADGRALAPYGAVRRRRADRARGVGCSAYGLFAGGLGAPAVLLAARRRLLVLFIGVAMIASRLVSPLAGPRLAVARTGGAGQLARQNAVRNPARTARPPRR